MKKGKLFVLSGPSGVGKGTIVSRILEYKELNLQLSISMTTREKRANEIEGENYFFVNKETFQEAIKNNEMLEYSDHFDNYYGTPIEFLDKMLNIGINILLEIETHGAQQIMKKRTDAITIFMKPPSLKDLEKRLVARGTETKEKIQIRLKKAKYEIKAQKTYDHIIINKNDEIDNTEKELKEIIEKELNNEF